MFTQEDYDLINKEFEQLKEVAQKRCANQEEIDLVVKAFEFANEAHKGVRRKSGEPYILHPISVAKIVVQEIGLGCKSIISALLHDVVEDTDYTVEDISRLFGAKVASIVDGLTKIKSAMDDKHNKEKMGEKSMQAENFKRILLTLNDDIRVVLIKLADRLHNLRTIGSMPERKKDKILSETMYIFIPLAHRLGLYSMKSEMENIWLIHREPEEYKRISKMVENLVDEKGYSIDEFIEPVAQTIRDEGYKFTIIKRTKTPYSIWHKMNTKNISFEEIYDLFAVRIIFDPKEGVSERKQCWDIFALISSLYRSKNDRIRDWVTNPKSNGYEALHCTLMSNNGHWIEVQIRSRRMDEIAERGLAAHWSYKGVNKNENDIDKWLNQVRSVLENSDVNALQFLDSFHEGILASEMSVFTPSGETKTLPKGATALDYAYHIHSDIGNRAIAAKVNFKLVPLSHVLMNGDQVEIVMSDAKNAKPQKEWLNFVTTSKAKNFIYESLKTDTKDAIKEGNEILENALNKLGIKLQARVINKLLIEFKLNNKEELYIKLATGLVKLDNIEEILKKNNPTKKVNYWGFQLFFGGNKEIENDETDEEIKGINNKEVIDKKKDYYLKENLHDRTLSYKIADCCHPIPGDAITAFVDDNNNVIVHKKVCEKATALASVQGGKILNVKWTKHNIQSFLTRIALRGIDRMGIVTEITKYITLDLSVNIRKIHFQTHDGIFEGYIDLYVHDVQDLETMIETILKVKGVDSAVRTDAKDND